MLTHIMNDLGCVCFHGLGRNILRFLVTENSIPQNLKKEHGIPFTDETMHPEVLFQYLKIMQERMHISKSIGTTHTFYTTSKVREAIENLGGIHLSIIRNPANRISSQINTKIKDLVMENSPDYHSLDENRQQDIIKKIVEENSKKIEAIFNREPLITYVCDYDNITHSRNGELIFFEGMFDSGLQNPLLDKIALISGLDKEQIANKFSNYNKINEHLNFKIDFSFIINDELRDKLRNIILNVLEQVETKMNTNFQEKYSQVNYEFNIDAVLKKFKL